MYKLYFFVKTSNRGEIMKKFIIYSIYSICFVLMLSVVVAYNVSKKNSSGINMDYDYVQDIIESPYERVNNEVYDEKIIKPFNDNNVKVVKGYYNYKLDEKEQENSIIYYDNTYMQNTGISYSSGKAFDVLAIYDGEVVEVSDDDLVGNSITIKHNDKSFSIYQSVDNIKVKKGDKIKKGDVLALSGTSNISKELKNHLYFEIIIDGVSVNPEEYYDKTF